MLHAIQAWANVPSKFLQGAKTISTPFKAGILCVGNPTERLEVLFCDAARTATSSVSIAAEGTVSAAQVRTYQYWYLHPGGVSPCGNGSNSSNAVRAILQ